MTAPVTKARGALVRRALGAALVGALALASPATSALAAGLAPTLRSASTTQMSSAPETVYVNTVSDPAQRTQSFNKNWKFYLGEATGASQATFDDSTWENVNVPHDYSIDQAYSESGEGESAYKLGGVGWYRKSFEVGEELAGKRVRIDFDGVYMNATVYINGHELGTHPYGYSPFSFDLTPYLNVGGQNTIAVRVNHQTPSSRWYSGSGIGRDVDLVVTDPVHVAKDGVRVTTPNIASEHATGTVTTALSTTLANEGEKDVQVSVTQSVLPKDGGTAIGSTTTDQTVAAGATTTFASSVAAANPTLWDTENPALYVLRTEVSVDGTVVDTYDTTFGYRWFEYDSNNGFYLNGSYLKLQGVCLHHDQGSLGSVDTRAAVERQVRIMKEMGVNSIRTSHNTPSRTLVEVCEEEGILLNEEIFDGWTQPKNGNVNDYSNYFGVAMGTSELVGVDAEKTWAQWDLEQTIARDANSPSVIMWSVGNEMITGTPSGSIPNFETIQLNLINWVKGADPTRPATLGDNQLLSGSWNYHPDNLANAGGVIGINYALGSRYENLHQNNPSWVLYGSETVSATNSRGVYDNVLNNSTAAPGQQLTSYDRSCVSWGHLASQAWYDTVRYDYVMGEYVWTGFDYLGEPTPWNGTAAGLGDGCSEWPCPKNSYFGIVDTAGLPKDSYYFYQSQWNKDVHTLHILPAWNDDVVYRDPSQGGKVPVVVYTDAAQVELFFTPADGGAPQSLGKKTFKTVDTGNNSYQIDEQNQSSHTGLYFTWYVPYEDGTISAKAYDAQGSELDTADWEGRQSVTTTGEPAALVASVDRSTISADGADLAYVTVSVVDADGNIVPDATNNVTFEVTGAGELAAVDNGSSPDWQSYRDNNRDAWAGQLVGIVRADSRGGDITVKVTSGDLKGATVSITAEPTADAPAEKSVDSLFFSRYYYVKTGTPLTLPETVTVTYTDGTTAEKNIAWGSVSDDQLAQPGSFEVAGEVEGARVSAVVTVIDDVAAVLNYSTTTPVGQVPAMPDARPGAMADGTIINANFPVTWQMPEDAAFGAEGTVEVSGTASVFGRDVPVSATVRVQSQTYELGGNIAQQGGGSLLRVEQDVPADLQSDTLEAIVDGSTAFVAPESGQPNTSVWTNYDYAQQGGTTSSVTIVLNTSLGVGQAKVYFVDDDWSAAYPKANTTKIEVSGDGSTWVPVTYEETIAAEETSEHIKLYTYDFSPVNAVFMRFTVTNSDEVQSTDRPCVGISEIQLISATGSYTTNATARLASLTVNGQEAPASALEAGSFDTPALVADVEAVGADNAAVTVLPAQDGVVRIVVESEDHTRRETFVINLGQESSGPSAEDDSRDYPVEKITPTAGSEELAGGASEGPVRLAFDGNTSTMYHSAWNGAAREDLWVAMELEGPAAIDALRYLPRQSGGNNGKVLEYAIEASDNGQTWTTVATGTWADDTAWKLAEFDEPVTAKYFRLKGVKTTSTTQDIFMSAAEIRLRRAEETVDLSDATVKAPETLTVNRVDAEHPAFFAPEDVSVTLTDGTELTYGVDYILTYENNTQEGQALLVVRGIHGGTVNYTGEVEFPFVIEVAEPVLEGISVTTAPTQVLYTEGDTLDPTGLVLTLAMSDGTSRTVAYGADNADDFTFSPTTLDTVGHQDVTVTYGGFTALFTVTVEEAGGEEPGTGEEPGGEEQPAAGEKPGTGEQPAAGEKPGSDRPAGSRPSGTVPETGDPSLAAGLVAATGVMALLGARRVGSRRR